MNAIERRVCKAEGQIERNAPNLTLEQIDARIDEILAKGGATQAEMLKKHGSCAAWIQALKKSLSREDRKSPEDQKQRG